MHVLNRSIVLTPYDPVDRHILKLQTEYVLTQGSKLKSKPHRRCLGRDLESL